MIDSHSNLLPISRENGDNEENVVLEEDKEIEELKDVNEEIMDSHMVPILMLCTTQCVYTTCRMIQHSLSRNSVFDPLGIVITVLLLGLLTFAHLMSENKNNRDKVKHLVRSNANYCLSFLRIGVNCYLIYLLVSLKEIFPLNFYVLLIAALLALDVVSCLKILVLFNRAPFVNRHLGYLLNFAKRFVFFVVLVFAYQLHEDPYAPDMMVVSTVALIPLCLRAFLNISQINWKILWTIHIYTVIMYAIFYFLLHRHPVNAQRSKRS